MKYFIYVASLALVSTLWAGPEIYDPLSAYKQKNQMKSLPLTGAIIEGESKYFARYIYKENLLIRVDYLNAKKELTGYSLFAYKNDKLVLETLHDASQTLVEEIQYVYKKDRLEKTLIHDIKGATRIEWHYQYGKDGELLSGKRYVDKKVTESFKIERKATGVVQQIFNAQNESVGRVEATEKDGKIVFRHKTDLTGAKSAEYKYDAQNRLIEIVYYEEIKGQKTLVKKQLFEFSQAQDTQKTGTLKAG